MKTPPLLLGAALLFWGWQSGLLWAGAVMALVLEGARFVEARWEVSDDDFRRILTFCTLLAFALVVYAFTTSREGGGLGDLFYGPAAARNVTVTGVRTSTAFFRWLPMILFLFVAAQTYSTRDRIPWTAVSIISRRRRRPPAHDGKVPPAGGLNASYPYLLVCLFSASIHTNEGRVSFFWGQCGLIAWALWPLRPKGGKKTAWAAAMAAVIGLGFFGQRSLAGLQRLLEGYNAQWLARFLRPGTDPLQSMTAIGRIGELKLSGRIVIRLHTPNGQAPPAYLREASYRVYLPDKRSWYAGTPRGDFETISPETNQTTWVLLPKTNTASVNIACYLEREKALLPLPTGCGTLENLNAYLLQKNSEGAVLAEGPGLVIFDADYGPGATIDSAPEANSLHTNLDLLVPAVEAPALKRVVAELKISSTNESWILRAVYRYFQNHFTYSVWQKRDEAAPTNETPVAHFLLTSRQGHCEYFATATVLLLRELNIPARYAVGFAVHEKSGSGYVVRERDAHAWCLVWDRQSQTWKNFDTTPASWVEAEAARASPLQWLSDLRSWIGFQIAKLRWGQTHLRQYLLWSLAPVLALLLYQIIFRRRSRRQPGKPAAKGARPVDWPGLDSEFYRLERKLAERGLTRQPGEPLSTWLQRVLEQPGWTSLRKPLQGLLRLHYRHRFDPAGLNPDDRERLRREAERCLSATDRHAP